MLAYISGLVVVSDMENSEKIKKILPMTIFNLILPTLDIGTDLRLGLAVCIKIVRIYLTNLK